MSIPLPENVFVNFLVMGVSFFILSKSAGFLVDGAVGIAYDLKVPKMAIGILIVSFATTAPEFTVSVISSIRHEPEFAFGNAVGSVIANNTLALALGILVAPAAIKIDSKLLKITGLWLIGIDIFAFFLSLNGVFDRWEGGILIIILVAYLFSVFLIERKRKKDCSSPYIHTLDEENDENIKQDSLNIQIIKFTGGVLGIIAASLLLIEAAKNIASFFGVSKTVVGLTLIAMGTSLPEVFTCIIASRKGHGDLAFGDIVGADVLNILWIIGASSLANPIEVALGEVLFSFPFMLVVVVTMLGFARMGYRLEKWKGIVLLSLYIVFITLAVLLFVTKGIQILAPG